MERTVDAGWEYILSQSQAHIATLGFIVFKKSVDVNPLSALYLFFNRQYGEVDGYRGRVALNLLKGYSSSIKKTELPFGVLGTKVKETYQIFIISFAYKTICSSNLNSIYTIMQNGSFYRHCFQFEQRLYE